MASLVGRATWDVVSVLLSLSEMLPAVKNPNTKFWLLRPLLVMDRVMVVVPMEWVVKTKRSLHSS